MSMADATGKVERAAREALQAVCPDVGVIDGSANLAGELGMDSVQMMDLIMEIEDRLEISIPVAVVADVRTFDQLCASVSGLAQRA